jgi:hypothetical protein
MNCPYCNRRVGDVPNHLRKSPVCHKKHGKKLLADLDRIIISHAERWKQLRAAGWRSYEELALTESPC